MSKQGLLSRLISYAPREGRVARENFFTEAFAHIMLQTPELARHVLALLTQAQVPDEWQVSIETQRSYLTSFAGKRCRPDIVVELSSSSGVQHVIFIESKIDAVAADGQLANYRAVLDGLPAGVAKDLVFLTRDPELIESDDDLQVKRWYWGQVRAWILQWCGDADAQSVLVKELLMLMEDLQMSLEVSARELVSAVDYFGAREKLKQIIGASWEAIPELGKLAGGGKQQEVEAGLIATSKLIDPPGLHVYYGFLLNMKNPWHWADFPNQVLPVAMVAVYVPDTADASAFRREHSRSVDALVANGWQSYDDPTDPCCIAAKLSRELDVQQLDLAAAYQRFLMAGLRDVADVLARACA